MVNFVKIDGVDYSNNFFDWDFEKSNNFFAGSFELILFDENGTVKAAIERYNQVELYHQTDGTKKYTGVITNITSPPNNSSLLNIIGLDYWTFLLRESLIRTFTNQSASQILISVINTELAGLNLTTTGVIATTNIVFNDATETKMIYRGNQSIAEVFQDLASREDYVVSIDETKDVIFRSNIAVDSGIHLVYGGDMYDEEIQKLGGDLVNVVQVRGAPGQPPSTNPVGAIVEDDALIAKYATSDIDGRLPVVTISRTELATVDACEEAGRFEIKKRNQDPDRGPIRIPLNFNLDVNELVTLTIPHQSITAQTFMIQTIRHHFRGSLTTVDVIYYTRETADLVQLIMQQNRGTELYLVDDGLVFTKIKTLMEEITLTAFVDIDKRTFAGAEYGEFGYSTKYYGQASGSFTSQVSNRQIQVQNKLFENWLRIIGQIATVPNVLDGDNSFIAIGSDSTAIQVTDTTLTSENFRKPMMPGHPNSSTDLKLIFKALLDDTDAVTATLRNLALFDNSPLNQGIVARYRLDSDATDSSPNSNAGTNNGVTFVSGKVNNAGDFEKAENDNIALPNFSAFTVFSITAWFKLESLASADNTFRHIITLRETATAYRINIFQDWGNDKLQGRIVNASGSFNIEYSTALVIGTWYHVILTWTGSNLEMFVNNISVGNIGTTGTLPATDSDFIGSFTGVTNNMDGLIDDVRLYNRILNASERKQLFEYRGVSPPEPAVDLAPNMLLADVLASNLSKAADEEWNITITLVQASGTGFLTTSGANLLRDLLSIASVDFLNNANAAIEIITTPVNRDGMDSGFPKFITVSNDQLKFEVTIDTTTLDGKTFAGVDLYNKTSGGIQVIDGALAITTTIVSGQNMKIQVLIKFVR